MHVGWGRRAAVTAGVVVAASGATSAVAIAAATTPTDSQVTISLDTINGDGGPDVRIAAKLGPAGQGGTITLYDGAKVLQSWTNYATRGGFVLWGLANGMHPFTVRFTPADTALQPSLSNEIDYLVGHGAAASTTPSPPAPTATSTGTAVMIVPLPAGTSTSSVTTSRTPSTAGVPTASASSALPVRAAGSTGSHGSTLPFTGANVVALTWAGVLLCAVGAALRFGRRPTLG